MKRKRPLSCAIAATSFLFAAASTQAASILAVDFGSSGPETGFLQQNGNSQTHSTTGGDVTIAVTNVQGIFNFATTGTNDDLYRDFMFRNGGVMTMTISGPGISASTDYDLTFWSYYGQEGRNVTFNPGGSTAGPSLGPIAASNSPAPAALLDPLYTTTGTYTSDNTGALTILVGGTNSRPVLNALDISDTAIPEPTSLALLGFGGLALLRRRRH